MDGPLIDVSDNDLSKSDNAMGMTFHRRDQTFLEVLSLQLSAPILPFIEHYQKNTGVAMRSGQFKKFVEYSTTN